MKDNIGLKGRFKIKVYRAGTKELLRESAWINNLIVSSDGFGRNLLLRRMNGNTTYTVKIDSASIGTGTTAPVDSDVALETSVLASISVAQSNLVNDVLSFDFFITDGELANDTYTEFGLFMNGRLFSRSLITPVHTKSTNEDTTISYEITFSTT